MIIEPCKCDHKIPWFTTKKQGILLCGSISAAGKTWSSSFLTAASAAGS